MQGSIGQRYLAHWAVKGQPPGEQLYLLRDWASCRQTPTPSSATSRCSGLQRLQTGNP